MKKTIALILTAFAILIFDGCSHLAADGPYKGDATLYAADKAITESKSLFDTFLKFEKSNRELLRQWPEIKTSADEIRANGKRWVLTAMALRDAYAITPSAENKAALEKAISVIRAALTESAQYLTEHQTAK